jgi:hypothetical protein
MGEMRGAYRILAGNPGGKRPLPGLNGTVVLEILKWILKF